MYCTLWPTHTHTLFYCPLLCFFCFSSFRSQWRDLFGGKNCSFCPARPEVGVGRAGNVESGDRWCSTTEWPCGARLPCLPGIHARRSEARGILVTTAMRMITSGLIKSPERHTHTHCLSLPLLLISHSPLNASYGVRFCMHGDGGKRPLVYLQTHSFVNPHLRKMPEGARA